MVRPDTARRKSTTRFAIELILVLIVVCVAVYLVLLRDLERTLKYRLDRLHAMGVPQSWAEVIPPPVPDDDNAAVVYQQAFDRIVITDADLEQVRQFLSDDPPGSRLKLRARVKSILARNAPALDLLRQAAGKPACGFPINWDTADPYAPYATRLPYLHNLLRAAWLVTADAVVATGAGKVDRVLNDYGTVVRMARHSRGPHIYQFLNRTSLLAIALGRLPDALAVPGLKANGCADLYEELRNIDLDGPYREVYTGEMCTLLSVFEAADKHPRQVRKLFQASCPWHPVFLQLYVSPLNKLLRLREEIASVQWMQEGVALSRMPYREAAVKLGALESRGSSVPAYWLISRLFPRLSRAQVARDRAIALRNVMMVALSLKAYHAKYRAYPDSLAALRAYPGWELPEDPFSGKPFGYRRKGTGFVLYSWGEDLDDDGGRPIDPQSASLDGDIVWEFKR